MTGAIVVLCALIFSYRQVIEAFSNVVLCRLATLVGSPPPAPDQPGPAPDQPPPAEGAPVPSKAANDTSSKNIST